MIKLFNIRLDLFDGGAAGAAGSGAGAGTGASGGGNTGGNAPTTGASNGSPSGTSPVSARRSKSGAFDNVKFGKQPSAQDVATNENAVSSVAGKDVSTAEEGAKASDKPTDPEARRKAYRELVEGEFKDLYQEDTQNIVKQRFKENRDLRETSAKQKEVLDILAQRYGIEDGDPVKIQEAIDKDNGLWADMAADAGFDDVSKYRDYMKLQAETKNLREAEKARREAEEKAQKAAHEQRYVQEQMSKWTKEGEALKAKYPNFDISADLQDKSFVGMLRLGVPMEVAYHAMHHSEIVSNAVSTAKAETEKNVVDNIRARGSRPLENGTQSQSSFTVRDDPHSLTKAERAEIARRAGRGEVIRF
jgi:hypothetical protein